MNQPKIIVLDAEPADSGDLDWSPLRELGDLTLHPLTAREEVVARIADAEIVLTNKVKLPGEFLDKAPKLKLISVLATGHDVVDIQAAREQGITVCNVPAYSTASAAQTAVALLLELTQHAGAHSEAVKAGGWTRSPAFSFWNFPLVELEGKTLVVIGLGAIGRRVAQICEAMGMNIIVAQLPGREGKQESPYPRLPLAEALPLADIVTLHCPATPQTVGLVNAEFLRQLKPSAILLNTARGTLIDENAVAEALNDGRLAGFGADVLSSEPPAGDNPLLSAANSVITPHIAWASMESRRRLLNVSADNVRSYLAGGPQNVVS